MSVSRGTPPPEILDNSPLNRIFDPSRFPGWKLPSTDLVVLLIIQYARTKRFQAWEGVVFTEADLDEYADAHAAELPAPYNGLWVAEKADRKGINVLLQCGYVARRGGEYCLRPRFWLDLKAVFMGA